MGAIDYAETYEFYAACGAYAVATHCNEGVNIDRDEICSTRMDVGVE